MIRICESDRRGLLRKPPSAGGPFTSNVAASAMPVPDPMKRATRPPPPPACPRCFLVYRGTPDQCPRCGAPLRVTAEELHRLGQAERGKLHRRKTLSDAFFLAGLLLGGPVMTFGGQLRLGALVVLAGALASALRRYTDWSTPGTVVVGALLTLVAAAWIAEPHSASIDETAATQAQRAAYAQALAEGNPDVLVEPRGPDLTALWFTLPTKPADRCGDYPGPKVRRHLADLGFNWVVVEERNASGGLCSFAP
jgi:hypothetical protein